VKSLLGGAGLVVVAALMGAQGAGLFDLSDERLRDRLLERVTLGAIEEPIAVVGIDEASLEAFPQPLVLWGPILAEVVDAAAEAGATAVGLDFLLKGSAAEWFEGAPEELAPALVRARMAGVPVVLQAIQVADERGRPGPLSKPAPLYQLGAGAVGLANVTLDPDGVVRRQELGCEDPEAFAATVGRLARPDAELPRCAIVPLRWRDTKGRWPGPSVVDIVTHRRAGDVDWLKAQLGGKVLLVGSVAPSLGDHFRTPLVAIEERLTPGVEIHAHALHTLLRGDAPRPLPLAAALALLALLGTLSSLLGVRARASVAGVVVFGGAALWLIAGASMLGRGTLLPLVGPTLALIVPGIAAAAARFSSERATRRRLASTLGSYVNPHVLEAVLKDPEAAGIHGATRTVTVLMADIVGYSTFSEDRDPAEIVAVLNEYFTEVVEAIQEAGGTVDKFIGDGLLAIFGAPLPLATDGAEQALAAALDMERRLKVLQAGWRERGLPDLDIGIGVHTGEAVVGNIGSPRKMEFTVIGDAVNVAARIESTTRKYERRLLLSDGTVDRLRVKPPLTDLGEVHVKGRRQPVRLYGLADEG
jgi:adenylate cyclase